MSNAINNLFAQETTTNATSNRGLTGTAQLTSIASSIAANVISTMDKDVETYAEQLKASQHDNNAMDALIESINPLDTVDVEFLKEIDEATIDGMLKSQQSKRSRCKSKTMTIDNYRALMTGAIAENLIRLVTGKEKHASGARRTAGAVEYTVEQLQSLEQDQEKLRKEIRNVQSKKSIMRSKADFDESDERYQLLLKVEQQLKDMRIGAAPEVRVVDTTKNALNELLAGKDLNAMHAKDSKELLAQIAAMIGGEPEENTENSDGEDAE